MKFFRFSIPIKSRTLSTLPNLDLCCINTLVTQITNSCNNFLTLAGNIQRVPSTSRITHNSATINKWMIPITSDTFKGNGSINTTVTYRRVPRGHNGI